MTVGFFLRHLAGFFIQFGAGMALCLMPFGEGAFCFSRKRIYVSSLALAILASACFPLVINMSIVRSYAMQTLCANMYMLAALLLFVFMYFKMLRPVEMIKKLVVLVLALLYAAAQYLLVNLGLSLFPDPVLPEVYPPLTLALFAGTAAVMFPPFAILMSKAVKDYLAEMEVENIRREFGIILTITFLYLAILMIYASIQTGMLSAFWWIIVPPLMLDAVVLGVFYWSLFSESVRRKRDSDELRVMEIQKFQYKNITNEIEQTKKMRHDMRHTLNRLGELVESGELEVAREYLSEMTEQVSHRDTTDYCKNNIVNGLLQYYVGMAEDKGIRCKVRAECGDITIAPTDMTVLVGNMMENAIHACEQVDGERWIAVKIGVIGGSMLIEASNPCQGIHPSGKYRMDGGFLPAGAYVSGRNGGGYGLYSLEHTAEEYGGEARFCFDADSKIFTARIRLGLGSANL
ncbi:MAG: GHKL domain-containing protein [Clostridiales bacterium]|nr:GHKL domain-containing protein [Clostridiales bacterium]